MLIGLVLCLAVRGAPAFADDRSPKFVPSYWNDEWQRVSLELSGPMFEAMRNIDAHLELPDDAERLDAIGRAFAELNLMANRLKLPNGRKKSVDK